MPRATRPLAQRLHRFGAIALLTALGTIVGCTTNRAVNDPTTVEHGATLPLQRVRLYESGVAYFERRGPLEGASSLPVPAAHLDDALKTLVVLDGNVAFQGVSFATRLSPAVARARARLPASQDAPLSYDKLLTALRGEVVEVTLTANDSDATEVRGRVIDVVAVAPSHPSFDHGPPHQTVPKDAAPQEDYERLQVLLLSEAGELLRIDAGLVQKVTPLDTAVLERLNAAMNAHVNTRSNEAQLLDLLVGASPGHDKNVAIAYLAEAPVWRASYRLRLSAANSATKAQLQAWALVHNDTDEHWRNVQLELVHGQPKSFLYPLTAPRYERRDLETPNEPLSSVPQLSTTTPDAMWGDFSDYEGEALYTVGSGGVSGTGSGQGFGSGHGRVGGSHRTKRPSVRMGSVALGSDLLWAGDLRAHAKRIVSAPQTTPVFSLDQRISIAAQHSAMVPFLKAQLEGIPVLWFNDFDAQARRAVAVSNVTPYTLPAGPLAVFSSGGFMGEAVLETLQPGARQFALIGDEPESRVRASTQRSTRTPLHVDYRNGALRVHSRRVTTATLVFNNQTGTGQRAYVALPVVVNAAVWGADDVDFETTSGRAFGVFKVPKGSGAERVVTLTEAISEATDIGAVSLAELDELRALTTLPETERAILNASRPLLADKHATDEKIRTVEQRLAALGTELERLRADLSSIGSAGAGGGQAPLVARIFEREDESRRLADELRLAKELAERQQTDFEDSLTQFESLREGILAEREQATAAK